MHWNSFWEIKFLSEKDPDRWTTENSALGKLRCLSAGGAKKKQAMCVLQGILGLSSKKFGPHNLVEMFVTYKFSRIYLRGNLA